MKSDNHGSDMMNTHEKNGPNEISDRKLDWDPVKEELDHSG